MLREMLQLREILGVALVRQMSGLHVPDHLARMEADAAHLPDVRSIIAPAGNARWHRAILDAVRRGDADAAAVAMREHFTGIQIRLNYSAK